MHRILCTNFCACNVLNKRFQLLKHVAGLFVQTTGLFQQLKIFFSFFLGGFGGKLLYCCSIAKEPCLAIKIPMGPMKPGRPRQTPGASHGCQPATPWHFFGRCFLGESERSCVNPGESWDSSFGCFQKEWYPQIIHFNRVFHYKPSILGYP